MTGEQRELIARKRAALEQFLADLRTYAELDMASRRREHYAVERLLQLLCESAADIGLQLLKMKDYRLATGYREIFAALREQHNLPDELAEQLMDACAMRNVLTHLYDTIDQERVIRAVDPAISLYQQYDDWVGAQM
ncbi:MAG: type VII toxin-antitoxin system HepT family RNase toxin [Spirochaetota bacterium]